MMAQQQAERKPKSNIRAGQRQFIFGVTAPTILFSAGFTLLAIFWALALMFFDYSPGRAGGPILGLGGNNPFVGFEHFKNMLSGTSLEASLFRTSLKNTIIFALVVLPLNLLITLPLAALIESVSERFKTIFRAIYFLPAVTSSVGVALMWKTIYHPQQGLLNAMILAMGGKSVAWLTDPRLYFLGVSVGMWAVILARLWQDYGYNLVIFIAALQGIPKEFKEAAMIDGATPIQIFRYITVPLLKPTLTFVCVMTMLSSFQVFDIIQVMTNGGPDNQTRVLVIDIYENAFRYQSMGWSAAVSFILVGLIMFITLVQLRLLKTDWEY